MSCAIDKVRLSDLAEHLPTALDILLALGYCSLLGWKYHNLKTERSGSTPAHFSMQARSLSDSPRTLLKLCSLAYILRFLAY